IHQNGRLQFAALRIGRPAECGSGWAEVSGYATPFVKGPAMRRPVGASDDLDERIDSSVGSEGLRANGILDTESYRKLGRNQLRIALFPAIDPEDVAQLTRSIDHVVERLSA